MDLQCGNSICGSSLRSITPLGALRAATSPSLPAPKWRRVALLRNGRQASAGRARFAAGYAAAAVHYARVGA
jgi:hypothetical protein